MMLSDRYYTRSSLFLGPIIIRCFTMLIDRRHNYAAELAALRVPDAQLMQRHWRIIGHRTFSLFLSFWFIDYRPTTKKTKTSFFCKKHFRFDNFKIFEKKIKIEIFYSGIFFYKFDVPWKNRDEKRKLRNFNWIGICKYESKAILVGSRSLQLIS